jgi:hypothetical protein
MKYPGHGERGVIAWFSRAQAGPGECRRAPAVAQSHTAGTGAVTHCDALIRGREQRESLGGSPPRRRALREDDFSKNGSHRCRGDLA